jgi:mannose-6-phosphate isomerase-like protein (cupin superfamily)
MPAQGVRVLKPQRDGQRFTMGNGVNWKVIFPEMGAKNITLNYVEHAPGVTFTPHVHDESEDVIIVLSGHGTIVSNDDVVAFEAGDVLYVPAGVYHGTTNTGDEPLIMFSCQAPPDVALYTGARDKPRS